MRKLQYRAVTAALAAAIILSTTIFSGAQCYADSNDDYKYILSEFLEVGPAAHLDINVHGRNSENIDKALTEIYSSNGLQPFWIENGKPSQRATDIISVLENAESHGLDPSAYFVELINQHKDSKHPADMIRLDILLSIGMMRYVADQREGRIQARKINPVLFESASDVEVDWAVLRPAAFQAADMKVFLDQQAPPFLQYRELQKKLAEYRSLAASGGWPTIPHGETLKPGMDNPRVIKVRQRLAATGELAEDNLANTMFDPELEEAVKRFQKRHNLNADAAIGKLTLAAMNVTVKARINQIIVNMERYRWLKRDIQDRMVVVNIAGFQAYAGVPGNFDLSMPVVVGKLRHETPVFSDTIKYVDFNPYWNLPPSIARNETLPKLKQDSSYLQKHNMKIFQGWGDGAKELDATKIDWSKVSKKDMNQYHVRQEPGPDNALGTLKLVFPNKYDVYLHDTPAHELFKREKRAFSHGCIRMGRAVEMASWVLGGEEKGWGIERVKEVINTRKRKVVVLENPVPVHILYRTAFVDTNSNTLHFYDDVYGRDKILARVCCSHMLTE